MKRFLNLLLLCFLSCLFAGCFGQNKTDTFSVTPEELTDIPVIFIETKNTGKSVMDFVTEPVASHVSEAIASWTPDYKMPPAPYYEACTVTLRDADQTVLLDTVNAEVKVRGNWTTSYEKKPLRIKFEESQNMLGLNNGAIRSKMLG